MFDKKNPEPNTEDHELAWSISALDDESGLLIPPDKHGNWTLIDWRLDHGDELTGIVALWRRDADEAEEEDDD